MTWRQFFYPEKYGIKYTRKLTLMRTMVAELVSWAMLFLAILPMSACVVFATGQSFAVAFLVAWKGAWVWFVLLLPVPLLAYIAVAWHFNRRLSREPGVLQKQDFAHRSATL